MNRMALFLIVLLFVCCKDIKKRRQNMVIPRDEYGEYIELLNRDLTREVKSWIQFVTTKIDTVSSKNVCFTIEFSYEDVNSTSLERDTMILISHYNKHAGSYTGYKGVLLVNNYFVAILDKDDIGTGFYSKDMLLNSSIYNFESISVKHNMRPMILYRIKDGKLKKEQGLL